MRKKRKKEDGMLNFIIPEQSGRPLKQNPIELLIFFSVVSACGLDAQGINEPSSAKIFDTVTAFVSVDRSLATPAMRFYGKSPSFTTLVKLSGDVDAVVNGHTQTPIEFYRPTPVVIGPPLIEPRGMVKGKQWLFISDSGHDETHSEPATIWRLDPQLNNLEVFYRGPLLTNSKWLWYVEGKSGRPDELLISDFGEETVLHREGGGVGAKVFAIEVKSDGSPGSTRVLHDGSPFRDPQGITVIGETVIVADTRAGEMRSRPDAPEVTFSNGVVFALPLKGGRPIRLLKDQLFVTLVGSCAYFDGDTQYLRFWDIDGGRRDTSKFAWMPHSGFALLKRTRVESVNPLKFGPVEVVPFIEEFPINLNVGGLKDSNVVVLRGLNGTTLAGGNDNLVLKGSGRATIIAESPTTESNIYLEATIFNGDLLIRGPLRFDIRKDDANIGNIFRDNKHAGAKIGGEAGWVDVTVDGLAKTVALFPRQGGVNGLIWQGAPLSTPMASQISPDGTSIFVTDLNGGPAGTGAVWKLPMPSDAHILLMYSAGNAWKFKSRK